MAQQVNAGAPGVVYGVALILVMLFVPDGIVGGAAARRRAGPFRSAVDRRSHSNVTTGRFVAADPPRASTLYSARRRRYP